MNELTLRPIEGVVLDAPVKVSGGHRRRAVVQADIDAETYRALGPIAARKGRAVMPFINDVLQDIVGRSSLGDVVPE